MTESTHIKLFFYIRFTCIPSIYQIHYKIGGTPPHTDGGHNLPDHAENLTRGRFFDSKNNGTSRFSIFMLLHAVLSCRNIDEKCDLLIGWTDFAHFFRNRLVFGRWFRIWKKICENPTKKPNFGIFVFFRLFWKFLPKLGNMAQYAPHSKERRILHKLALSQF